MLILVVFIYWNRKLSHEVVKRKMIQKELQKLNKTLEIRIQKSVEKIREQDALVSQQSRLAQIGEMLGAIAHQWRSPLSVLHINMEMLEHDHKEHKIDEEFLKGFIEKNSEIIRFMSTTIDDFQNFYKIDKDKSVFDISKSITSVLNIQSALLERSDIEVMLSGESFTVFGYPGEFQQVIFELIENARDALLDKKTKDPRIKITMYHDGAQGHIELSDNGEEVDETILDKAFIPYFTTREQRGGTGMGLYTSKLIIEKSLHGKLTIIKKEKRWTILITLQKAHEDVK